MDAQPSPDGDELRARAYLRALRVRPFGHQDPPMPHEPDRRPVTPTRVIPAGAPLPARAPQPGEAPPWRNQPPAPPAPPTIPPPRHPWPPTPAPGPLEVRVTLDLAVPPEPDPEPSLWARLWDAVVTWRMIGALLLALTPWAGGHSPVSAWAATLHQARAEAGVAAAYVIAGVALAAAFALDRRTGRFLPRLLLVTALIGSLGVFAWYDPILLLTGVRP
ncbi:hypothetical protein OG481_09720 [Streptomyces longwoodensis]|uniref:hypothetical protein n=1 Tax=Streptomyces longwoodensis TaxID=68231 RepID=UPI002DDB9BB2|nr:hypothetical protein [Streptomyces longwoodensis]WRY88794.1 hypothetical protein OG481_09720 [Streptomyces longwoodensis]